MLSVSFEAKIVINSANELSSENKYQYYLSTSNTEYVNSEWKDYIPGEKFSIISGDCTMCGRCIDVCHQDALNYENRLKKLL